MSAASTAPPPPTIIINTPNTPITPRSPSPAPLRRRASKPQTTLTHQQSPTAPVPSCYLCDEQNPGDFHPTTTFLSHCLLCSRHFCPIHKSNSWDEVCDINHSEYYKKCLDEVRGKMMGEGTYDEGRRRDVVGKLVERGVFPSLGEREKSLFSREVDDDRVAQIADYRHMDAQISGNIGKRKSQLIEERDVVGADIAV